MKPFIYVKYVLYSHYANKDNDDLNEWRKNTTHVGQLAGVAHLVRHLDGLGKLLTKPDEEGMVILFYTPGGSFSQCLEGIAERLPKADLIARHEELRFADAVDTYLMGEFQQRNLSSRVRFITPLDMCDLFGSVNTTAAEKLRSYFVGPTDPVHYDTPKIIEAIVRLRLLGTGIPVFRLDHDVLFREDQNGNNKAVDDSNFANAIVDCRTAYKLRMEETRIATFLFSASYDTRNLGNNDFRDWSRAFATRIFPALPVVDNELSKIGPGYTWNNYANDVFQTPIALDLARKFYGFDNNMFRARSLSGIGKVGAHPNVSIISGAMLCLSDGAILDLPPFSNFGLNVSWIDDHLKYCLHRELRHLTFTAIPGGLTGMLKRDAKIDSVEVQKTRPDIGNLPSYVLGGYLPTLLWGTVMDAWITPEDSPLLKYRPEDLSSGDGMLWKNIRREGRSDAVLSAALYDALKAGAFSDSEERKLRKRLIDVALKRISEVREQWVGLAINDQETFASIWAKGEDAVNRHFPNGRFGVKEKCLGIPYINVPVNAPICRVEDLNRFLYSDFNLLVDDAIKYIRFALEWPNIVRVLRAVEPGTLKTDLS